MSAITDSLKRTFAALILWERRKRREEGLLRALCAALALALLLFPLHALLPIDWLRWFVGGACDDLILLTGEGLRRLTCAIFFLPQTLGAPGRRARGGFARQGVGS